MSSFRLLTELKSMQWAITPNALRGILSVLNDDKLKESDYERFHKASQADKAHMFDSIGQQVPGTKYTTIRNNVGFIFVDGPIVPRADFFSDVSGLVSIERLSNEFSALEKTDGVTDIVMIMDTPGGAVTGVSDFASMVRASKKRTTAYVFGMAASAGYWIASAADHIASTNTGLVGSIGTVLSFTDTTEADKKRGVKRVEFVSSQSPNKRISHETEEGVKEIISMLDDLTSVFIADVATGRGVEEDKVLSDFGKGSMFVANRALGAGMIDEITTMADFIETIEDKPNNMVSGMVPNMSDDNADITAEETMDIEEQVKGFSAEQLKELCPAAVEQIEKEAVASETERIKSVESLVDLVEGSSDKVISAAKQVVDANKFDRGKSEASISKEILKAVAKAQIDFVAEESKAGNEAAALVAQIDHTDETPEEEIDKQKVNGLATAMKEVI